MGKRSTPKKAPPAPKAAPAKPARKGTDPRKFVASDAPPFVEPARAASGPIDRRDVRDRLLAAWRKTQHWADGYALSPERVASAAAEAAAIMVAEACGACAGDPHFRIARSLRRALAVAHGLAAEQAKAKPQPAQKLESKRRS